MRFSSTPYELYKEMLSAVLCRDSQEAGAQKWLRQRLNVAMAQVDPDDDDENLPEADAPDAVNPDGYVPRGERLPKGHAIATAHAEAVLLDRVRELLDRHYDEVFVAEWLAKHASDDDTLAGGDGDSVLSTVPRRPRSHNVHGRVLEAHASGRCEIFRLPEGVRRLLLHPRDETQWATLEHFDVL